MQVVELGRSQAIAEQGFGEKGVPTRREIGPGAVLYDPERILHRLSEAEFCKRPRGFRAKPRALSSRQMYTDQASDCT